MPEIREVDPADEDELRRWWHAGHEAMAGRPHDLRESWETTRVTMSRPHGDFEKTLLTAHDGDDVVGSAMLTLPVADNLSMSYADVFVPPRHRRHGIGTALLANIEERARAGDRSYVMVEVISLPGVVSA